MIHDYFDKIFCINLDRRTDRWAECLEEIEKHNLQKIERISGVDDRVNGNSGCVASHFVVLKKIVENGWPRTLILEDDFKVVVSKVHEKFDKMVKLVPEDWDMLYLGGHYAEAPVRRINEHVIKHGRMFTTSSYGVTLKMAKELLKLWPSDYTTDQGRWYCGPIDTLYGNAHLNPDYNCYIFQPRLMVQRESYSDLCERVMNNEPCMMDPNHENMV